MFVFEDCYTLQIMAPFIFNHEIDLTVSLKISYLLTTKSNQTTEICNNKFKYIKIGIPFAPIYYYFVLIFENNIF